MISSLFIAFVIVRVRTLLGGSPNLPSAELPRSIMRTGPSIAQLWFHDLSRVKTLLGKPEVLDESFGRCKLFFGPARSILLKAGHLSFENTQSSFGGYVSQWRVSFPACHISPTVWHVEMSGIRTRSNSFKAGLMLQAARGVSFACLRMPFLPQPVALPVIPQRTRSSAEPGVRRAKLAWG